MMQDRYEEYDLTEQVGSVNYKFKDNKMVNHNWKMFVGFFIVFLMGGLQALKGLDWANGVETIIPVLLAVEHLLNGNTSNS